MNQERIRKQKYGVADPKATAEENAGKYGSPDCPGSRLRRRTSHRRSFGAIGARHEGITFLRGRAFHKSTEAGRLEEAAKRQKDPLLPPPARFTFRKPRAREGKDLQTNVS